MKALVVGLEEQSGSAVLRMLDEHGDVARHAVDLTDALAAGATEGRFSLVVVGGALNEGLLGTCRSLRSDPAFRDASILAVLADGEPASHSDVLAAGANDFYVAQLGPAVLSDRLLMLKRAAVVHQSHLRLEDAHDRLFQLSLDLLCVAGLDGRLREVNPAWTRTLGWSAEKLCSVPSLDFVHPDDLAATVAAGRALSRGDPVISFSNRYQHADGGYRWLDWKVMPSIAHGVAYGVARDVTPERERRQRDWEAAESMAAMLNSIGDAVLATDARGSVTRMNPVAERLTGWTSSEARGRPIEDVFAVYSEVTRAPVANPIHRVLAEGAPVTLDDRTSLRRRDGTDVPIADSCAPIRERDGAISGAVLVFRDISAERASQQAHQLARSQLVFAERMASVGTLAAGLAHEINNPLAYVTANLEMVIQDLAAIGGASSSPRVRELGELAAEALDGANRITKIVRGLKTFSRSADERRVAVELQPALEMCVSMTLNEIRSRARLVTSYGTAPRVEADDAQLCQVFINLLVNAAQALPDRPIDENEIRIATSGDDRGRAVIEIGDNGLGMSAAVRGRIFDPFYTTKEIGVGTGLGLSICRNIVTALGGEISVESTEGSGTTFRVVLPGATAPRDELPSSAPPPPPRTEPRVAPRASVLIVDDDPSVAAMLGRVLREHDVTIVSGGREALTLLTAGTHYDVILSDLMMPELSGIELYEALAARAPELLDRVVFVTGGACTPEGEAFLKRVTNERVEKPFAPAAIRALVGRLISRVA